MTQPASTPSCEDVLAAFSVEPTHGTETLKRYLREYPQYAERIIDLSRELATIVSENEGSLTQEDQALISAAWKRYLGEHPTEVTDPFAALTVNELREAAKILGVPRQIISAFREQRVKLDSIPFSFLVRFANAINCATESLRRYIGLSPTLQLGRSYKASGKPGENTRVSFEQLLIDAEVVENERAILLAEHD